MLQLTVLPPSQIPIQIQGSIRTTTYHPSENSESRLWVLQEGGIFCRITNFNKIGKSHSSKLSHLLASHEVNFYSDTKTHYRATTKMDRSQPLASNLRRNSYGIKELQTRPSPFVQNKQNPSRAEVNLFLPCKSTTECTNATGKESICIFLLNSAKWSLSAETLTDQHKS